jgi:hypothetical protein
MAASLYLGDVAFPEIFRKNIINLQRNKKATDKESK